MNNVICPNLYWIIPFKWVNYMWYELCVNKAVFKNPPKSHSGWEKKGNREQQEKWRSSLGFFPIFLWPLTHWCGSRTRKRAETNRLSSVTLLLSWAWTVSGLEGGTSLAASWLTSPLPPAEKDPTCVSELASHTVRWHLLSVTVTRTPLDSINVDWTSIKSPALGPLSGIVI